MDIFEYQNSCFIFQYEHSAIRIFLGIIKSSDKHHKMPGLISSLELYCNSISVQHASTSNFLVLIMSKYFYRFHLVI